jgi:hypothetical protein
MIDISPPKQAGEGPKQGHLVSLAFSSLVRPSGAAPKGD